MIRRFGKAAARRLRSVPRPLAGLLFAVATFGICWALVVPAFQGPDEIQHYSYVETLAQQHRLPGAENTGEPDPNIDHSTPTNKTLNTLFNGKRHTAGNNPVSTAVLHMLYAFNGAGVTVGIAHPEQSELAFKRWLTTTTDSQRDGGGTYPGSNYPPAYFAFDAIGYSLAVGGNVVDHLYAARLWSVLCLLLTTTGVWLLAGELFGRRRQLQFIAAAAVGLWPMISFMSSVVNPDALLYASWTWVFWAMAVVVQRGLTTGRLAILTALFAVAFLTKEPSIALAPSVAFVIGLGFWRLRTAGRAAWKRPALLLLLIAGVPVVGWIGLSIAEHRPMLAQANSILSGGVGNLGEFGSYVWQYYLPRLSGQQLHDYYVPVVSSYPAYNVWVASAWGAFGWVTMYFPHGVYPWFLAITLIIGTAAIARCVTLAWRRRRTPWLRARALPLTIAFGMAAFLLVAGLHLTEYKLRSPTNQGRYLFPLAGLAGIAVALAVQWIPVRARSAAIGGLIGSLVAFEIVSLGYVAAKYYA